MVHINGKDIDAAGQSLAAYLKANDYEMGTFVVECNEEIIHKEDYENMSELWSTDHESRS